MIFYGLEEKSLGPIWTSSSPCHTNSLQTLGNSWVSVVVVCSRKPATYTHPGLGRVNLIGQVRATLVKQLSSQLEHAQRRSADERKGISRVD